MSASASELASISANAVPASPAAVAAALGMTPAAAGVGAAPGAASAACTWAPWLFLIISIITLVIMFAIAKPQQDYYDSLNNNWSWAKGGNKTVWAIILVLVVLLMAYVTYRAYTEAGRVGTADAQRAQNWLIAGFVITCLLLIIWWAVFYRSHNLSAAMWLGIITLIVGIFLTWLIYKVHAKLAWGMIPYLLWAIAAVAVNWHLSGQNPTSP